ncbi:FAD-dependent oxidoreductase [Shimazuella sp. AN120528]|uniref:phytoene desaturase family protein n=1 Tax=Shimazuella soli TaxID=1892854 RepID=UPI001F0F69C6|nr:FAD-dependent oxidoreductase [Shimazuella soli]
MHQYHSEKKEVVVVGGGIAGLTVASLLGREGYSVTVIEKGKKLGGRAQTKEKGGFYFNQGAHSFYLSGPGPGKEILAELDVVYHGKSVNREKQELYFTNQFSFFPNNLSRLLEIKGLSSQAQQEIGNFLGSLGMLDAKQWTGISLSDWMESSGYHEQTRQIIEAIVRLGTYSTAVERIDTGFVMKLMNTLIDVWYLDGGWQTLIDGLEKAARKVHVKMMNGMKVTSIQKTSSGYDIYLADRQAIHAEYVVLTTDPITSSKLIDSEGKYLQQLADQVEPIYVACLDVALHKLPDSTREFVLGVESPLYYSVHSSAAKLAPENGELIHLMKYLLPEKVNKPQEIRQELEAFFTLIQPGWQEELVSTQYLPQMPVAYDLISANRGGLSGRPSVKVEGLPNLFIAGDWVGDEGQLAQASFASARQVVRAIVSNDQSF